jgi:hypothetical protein
LLDDLSFAQFAQCHGNVYVLGRPSAASLIISAEEIATKLLAAENGELWISGIQNLTLDAIVGQTIYVGKASFD